MNKYEHFFIDGQWRKPASDQTISVVSPSTQELIGQAPLGVEADIDAPAAAAPPAGMRSGPLPIQKHLRRIFRLAGPKTGTVAEWNHR